MTYYARKKAVLAFIAELETGLKSASPVRTGFLRKSWSIPKPSISKNLKIEVKGASYAIFVDNRTHFITDVLEDDLDVFATEFAESIWFDFSEENKLNTKK